MSDDNKSKFGKIKDIYENNYRKLLLIPLFIFLLAIIQIGYQVYTTGDFVDKGIGLKGGLSLIISNEQEIDLVSLESTLNEEFPNLEINARKMTQGITTTGFIIEADIDISDKEAIDNLVFEVGRISGIDLDENDYNIEGIGSSLGESFFKQAFIAIIVAFLFMGFVVFLYFRTFIPSLAVILAALSDMVVTLAVFNLLDVKLATAGIAAFLMLIGYSVDTDILLTIKVLKRKDEGTEMERIYSAMKTGLTMSLSTMAAVFVALLISESLVIKQIMLIVFIGLVIDLINTWIQNVAILRIYLERKRKNEG